MVDIGSGLGSPTVLLIEDAEREVAAWSEYLPELGFRVLAAGDLERAEQILFTEKVDVVLLDLRLGEVESSLPFADRSLLSRGIPVVVLSGYPSDEAEAEARRIGVHDVIWKGRAPEGIVDSLRTALASRRYGTIEAEIDCPPLLSDARLWTEIQPVARTGSPILILGETGTGKTWTARCIHEMAGRTGPFVPIECSARDQGPFDVALFGSVRGAFTGAEDRVGAIERAHRGTLFLDDIQDLSIEAQARLLHVLDHRSFSRLGETRLQRSDFLLVAAANRDLEREVECGRFRSDLLYRMRGSVVSLLPVREAREALPGLIELIRQRICADLGLSIEVAPRAVSEASRYAWNGNLRELWNAIHSSLARCRGPVATSILPTGATLPPARSGGSSAPPAPKDPSVGTASGRDSEDARVLRELLLLPLGEARDRLETMKIERALESSQGVVKRAAEHLGVRRSTLIDRMAVLGIRSPRRRGGEDA